MKNKPRKILLLMMAGLMANATGLKAQNLIAHFPLDADGDSSDGNFTASTLTDVEFGSEGEPAPREPRQRSMVPQALSSMTGALI